MTEKGTRTRWGGVYKPKRYRLCSCGQKLYSWSARRGHRKKGHHVPIKSYLVEAHGT